MQQTNAWFIFYCILFTVLFSYGLLETWRENNAKKDMRRDLGAEFDKANGTKRRR